MLRAPAQAGSLSSADWPHALHVLGHVVNNDLCAPALRRAPPTRVALPRPRTPSAAPLTRFARSEAARLVWKRLPAGAKEVRPCFDRRSRWPRSREGALLTPRAAQGDAELAAVWALLQALWTRDYAVRPRSQLCGAVSRARSHTRPRILALPRQGVGAALASPAWRPPTAQLVAAIAAGHRARTLALLSTAYTTIALTDACVFLALPEHEALAGTTQPRITRLIVLAC